MRRAHSTFAASANSRQVAMVHLMTEFNTGEDFSGAVCASVDPAPWFPKKGRFSYENQAARELCFTCPLRSRCLQRVIDSPNLGLYGIWGGMVPKQLRELVKAPLQGPGLPPGWGVGSTGRSQPSRQETHHAAA